MIKSLTRLLSIAAISTLAINAVADNHHKERLDPQQRFERLSETLNFSDAQAVSVQAIFDERREQHQQLRAERNSSREQMKALRADTREQLTTVLSEEQLQQFDAMAQQRKKRHHGAKDEQ